MYHHVRSTYYWSEMATDIYETARTCNACAKNSVKTTKTYACSTNFSGPTPSRKPFDRYPRTTHENEEGPPISTRNYGPLYENHANYPVQTNRRVQGSRHIRGGMDIQVRTAQKGGSPITVSGSRPFGSDRPVVLRNCSFVRPSEVRVA